MQQVGPADAHGSSCKGKVWEIQLSPLLRLQSVYTQTYASVGTNLEKLRPVRHACAEGGPHLRFLGFQLCLLVLGRNCIVE